MSKRVDLMVIDGENDFLWSGNEPFDFGVPPKCPPGQKNRPGSLFVAGADKEALLVAAMIRRLKDPNVNGGHKITNIHPTLDAHHHNDGSHNVSWKNGQNGQPCPPFQMITHEDVKNQIWIPTFAYGVIDGKPMSALDWALEYTKRLADKGKNPLIAWPVHCEIQGWGSCIYPPLQDAYNEWCEDTGRWIDPITKGSWAWTEHYSAMEADVPDSTRKETQLNGELISEINKADIIAWVGWAGSHCLPQTALSAVNKFSAKGANEFTEKSVFFEDACAPVVNPFDDAQTKMFAKWREDFLSEMLDRKAKVMKTTEFLA